MAEAFTLGEETVAAGDRLETKLKVARLPTGAWVSLPLTILHGAQPGPRIWLSATIHGDELNGMEIVRRVLARLDPATIAGTLLAAPVVNVFGFLAQDRYLPDRRDLNRCFPGSKGGSLAARLANLFTTSVVEHCDVGLDFHTGSAHRTNLPQIRADLKDPETRHLALAFGAPLMYRAKEISGSLRSTAKRRKKKILVFEGGEPLRFNRDVIEVGVRGTLRVLEALEMCQASELPAGPPTFEAGRASWIRSARSGMFHLEVELGERVVKKQVLGWVGDPLGGKISKVRSPRDGLVFAHTNSPMVYQGDALIHLASA